MMESETELSVYHIAVSNVHESAVPVTRVEEMSTSNSHYSSTRVMV